MIDQALNRQKVNQIKIVILLSCKNYIFNILNLNLDGC